MTKIDASALEVLLAGLLNEAGDLSAALRQHVEAVEMLAASHDQSMSGDAALFLRVPSVRSRATVVIQPELFAELRAARHPATQRPGPGESHTLIEAFVEDEGRGWLRVYELEDQWHSSWNLMVPLRHVEAVVSVVANLGGEQEEAAAAR